MAGIRGALGACDHWHRLDCGSSFYFIALDLGLRKSDDLPEKVHGEEWQVHGGGFYHVQKYLVAPDRLPEHLIWFKWESYSTWLSGFAMLILVYYMGAELYLIDPNVLDIPVWQAILISLGSLAFGWVIYDLNLQKQVWRRQHAPYGAAVSDLGGDGLGLYPSVHGPRCVVASGAFTATIMTANVFCDHHAEPAHCGG